MTIPSDLLQGKNILLGVSGSIAVYKSLELVRLYVKAGARVKVVMSEAAKKFVTPLTFETLCSQEVLDDTNESWVSEHNHIKSSQGCDIFVIAPATANTMAKLANGIADTMLLQCALATTQKTLLAPSANTHMLYNPATQANMQTLRQRGIEILNTQTKELACKTEGDGAMAEPIDIFWATAKTLLQEEFWNDRAVVISGGGTIEKIDEVRYISNFSSGKMAASLATALYCKGADVTLVATRGFDDVPTDVNTIAVTSSTQMFTELQDALQRVRMHNQKHSFLFMAAAVSDYMPKPQSGKLKKEQLGSTMSLTMDENIDILSSLDTKDTLCIGFKAEMDATTAMQSANNMLHKKKLDAVCLNILQDASSFGSESNAIEFITDKEVLSISRDTKLNIAFQIAQNAKLLEQNV